MHDPLLEIARDPHGLLIGSYTVRIKTGGTVDLFGFGFRDGLSTRPLDGVTIRRIVAAMGPGEVVRVTRVDDALDEVQAVATPPAPPPAKPARARAPRPSRAKVVAKVDVPPPATEPAPAAASDGEDDEPSASDDEE